MSRYKAAHAKSNSQLIIFVSVLAICLAMLVPIIVNATASQANADFMDNSEELTAFPAQQKDVETSLDDCLDAYRKAYTEGTGFLMASELMAPYTFAGGGVNDGAAEEIIDRFNPTLDKTQNNLFATE